MEEIIATRWVAYSSSRISDSLLDGLLNLVFLEIVPGSEGVPVLWKVFLWSDHMSEVNFWEAIPCSE